MTREANRLRFLTGYAYWGKRMYPQVIKEFKTGASLSGDKNDMEFAAALDQGFRRAGWDGALRNSIEVLRAHRMSSYSSPYFVAGLYAGLGDKEHAFEWLDIAHQTHDRGLINLNTDFLMDSIRSAPRFVELVRKVGLPATAE